MKFVTIHIEGSILSSDILDRIESADIYGQKPEDFGFNNSTKVKDEIARAWADAHDLWRVFCRQKERISGGTGTTETRKYWILPLLGLLGYDAEVTNAEDVNGKSYAISHRAKGMEGFPVHIMGFDDNLGKKRDTGGPRMSPHSLVQEYLNVTEHLYAIVTNGLQLRLLRDSSRLVKLSYIEFDLQAMMDEEQFADFAIMYRLLHASRMPRKMDGGAESIIEKYHQDALDSGSRIREGLSEAVESSIKTFADGFLSNEANTELRTALSEKGISDFDFYEWHLRLIYRLLFLMVIEERNLIYPRNADQRKRRIYYDYYSVGCLRVLCEKLASTEKGYTDLWLSLKNTFRIFEKEFYGINLNIKPLAGELFSPNAIGLLAECTLDNTVLVECLRNLSVFTNKNNSQKMRVNYASLNVEEFGSVYEGLLEYDPIVEKTNSHWHFVFQKGEERSTSGSHFTQEELVQPLIKNSLEYVIEEKLKAPDKEKALLSIRVCDVACGSGHILLSAARRIAVELARVRTGEDQPSPEAFREAVRDVIRHCIYGVDKNPLAVELCKVALWLEAHNPGEPLNFLNHHIKCGDAIVGLARSEELKDGISEDAFVRLPNDDKEVCAVLRKRNKEERNSRGQTTLEFDTAIGKPMTNILAQLARLDGMPENTPEEIEAKSNVYLTLTGGGDWWHMKNLADVQVAQFFIPKLPDTKEIVITDAEYQKYLAGGKQMIGQAVATAMSVGNRAKFFHWFLEFPEVFAQGGFDCVMGNPPFLGGQRLSGAFGNNYLHYLKTAYAPAGAIDLVGFFFRRDFDLLKNNSFLALISTNTIAQGNTREGALDVIANNRGTVNFAIRSMKWPGAAAVNVSLIAIRKGAWNGPFLLDGKKTSRITTYLDDSEVLGNPFQLKANEDKSFQGSIVLGKGFVLEPEEANLFIEKDEKYRDVIFPYLNGEDLNSRHDQSPSRWVINFFDWEEQKCRQDYPYCFERVERLVRPQRENDNREYYRKYWWQYAEKRNKLYRAIAGMDRVLVTSEVTKYLSFSFCQTGIVYSANVDVFTFCDQTQFCVLNSNIHEVWARKYSATLESRLKYSPGNAFEPFPFPNSQSPKISDAGGFYCDCRNNIVFILKIGLTKLYNLFHTRDLTIPEIEKVSKQPTSVCEKALPEILHLRELHREMDLAVLSAYGWDIDSSYGPPIDLRHDFYEVEYLPEDDRVRYTIHPDARREVLKRLLKLNHVRHAEEVKAGLWEKKKAVSKMSKKVKKDSVPVGHFGDQQELSIFIPGETRQGNLFDPSFPHDGREDLVFKIFPYLVSFAKGHDFTFYLNAALLLSDPESCIALVSTTEKKAAAKKHFESVKTMVPINSDVQVRKGVLRDTLTRRNLITISNNGTIDSDISDTQDLDITELKGLFPYAIEAAQELLRMVQSEVRHKETENISARIESYKAA